MLLHKIILSGLVLFLCTLTYAHTCLCTDTQPSNEVPKTVEPYVPPDYNDNEKRIYLALHNSKSKTRGCRY